MNKKTISITFLMLAVLCINTLPALAQTKFVEQFLNRYRPAPVNFGGPSAELSAQVLAARIQNGLLPLTVGDVG